MPGKSGGPFTALELRNVRCFADARVPLDPRLTVVIGGNGAGKTTVAEAIGSLTHGEDEGLAAFPLRHGERTGGIVLRERGRRAAASWEKRTKAETRRRLPDSRYVFAYGRYRRVFDPRTWEDEALPSSDFSLISQLEHDARIRRTDTLSRPDAGLLRRLDRYLVALHAAGRLDAARQRMWQRLSDSIRGLGEGLGGVEMERQRSRHVPVVVRRGRRLQLHELSDGYQALLVVIFDLLLRYMFLFGSLADPLDGEATVVIDEVCLHLHPRWQRTACRQLTKLFPKTQFVVTTHSPAVVQGAIDLGFGIVALREGKAGVRAVALSSRDRKDLEGAEIGSLLVDERLFGVRSRYSRRFGAVEAGLDRMADRVESGDATPAERKRLLRRMERLQELVARDEERRADGSFLSRFASTQLALLQQIAERADRSEAP